MDVKDVADIMMFLVKYCAPAALVINLVNYGVSVIIDAITGKGFKL